MLRQMNFTVLAIRWLILAVAVWVAAELVSGIRYGGAIDILIVAAVLGVLNLYLRPIFTLISLPLTVITLGLFLIVINAILLGLAAWLTDILGVDFDVDSIGAALLGAIIISLVSLILYQFVDPERIARDISGRRY
jgi:putative membrane protein